MSEKTIRVYLDDGLLAPVEIDPDNGYRYYTVDQSITLDRILQLQHLGFSLKEIKSLTRGEGSRLDRLRALRTQLEKVEMQIVDLNTARVTLQTMLKREVSEADDLGRDIQLEWRPEVRYLVYDVREFQRRIPSDVFGPSDESFWFLIMRKVRRRMAAKNIPMSLYNDLSCSISADVLSMGDMLITDACVLVPSKVFVSFDNEEIIPEGFWLSMQTSKLTNAEGEFFEHYAIRQMLDLVQQKGWHIRGRYLGTSDAREPFNWGGDFLPKKFQIPIDIV